MQITTTSTSKGAAFPRSVLINLGDQPVTGTAHAVRTGTHGHQTLVGLHGHLVWVSSHRITESEAAPICPAVTDAT